MEFLFNIIWFIIIYLILSYFTFKDKNKQINTLSNELIEKTKKLINELEKPKEVLFWIVNKPSEKDFLTLEKSSEALSLFIKIIHYEIAKTTDIARSSLENEVIQRNVWALNKLHELNLLLDKIKNYSKINNDEE